MIRTTSLKHYKELKAKGLNVQLVTKKDLNKQNYEKLIHYQKAAISQS